MVRSGRVPAQNFATHIGTIASTTRASDSLSLSLLLLHVYLSLRLSPSSRPPVSPSSSSSYLPSHARFVSSCPPSPSHLSTRTSPSPRRLLFLIPSPSRREIPSSSSPHHPPLSLASSSHSVFHFFPAASGASRASRLDFRVLRRPRITSVPPD